MEIQLEIITKTRFLKYQLKDEIKSLQKRKTTKSIEKLNNKAHFTEMKY